MTDRARIRRTPPERVSPIRKWDGLLGPTPSPDAAAPKPTTPEDLFSRSVELGYRVVDEYITRGQEAAQRLRRGAYGAEEMAQDVQGVASQLVRTASDFAGAWVEFFALAGRDPAFKSELAKATAASGIAPTPAAAGPAGDVSRASTSDDGTAAALRVRLRVTAACPVETALEVQSVPVGHALEVHQLRAADGSARIARVAVETGADGTACIAVSVPADQPRGEYSAAVLDSTINVAVGRLTIVVSALE